MTDERSYDVVLSFAGEDRVHAKGLADALTGRGVSVFYDEYEKAALWGKNLYTHLSDTYHQRARYCVMFLSQHYAAKVWTNHEREAAQARAFTENAEYILPVRLDDTEIPGILPTVGYVSCPPETADSLADLVVAKLRPDQPADLEERPARRQDTSLDSATLDDVDGDVTEARALARRDTDRVVKWLRSVGAGKLESWRRAAGLGRADAQWLVGMCHANGVGVELNESEGVRLIREAGERGSSVAAAYLASIYVGRTGHIDYPEALRWAQRATEADEPLGMLVLGTCYLDGLGTDEDPQQGVRWISKSASAGFVRAQVILGSLYLGGQTVDRNPEEAVKLFREAAQQGDAEAEYQLGICHYGGLGTPEDHKEAVRWFRRSASQGYAQGELMVGMAYHEGHGVGQNHGEAAKWFRRAAEQGLAIAQNQLGVYLADGKGIPANRTEAVYWYRKAAEQGHELAQANLNQPLNKLLDWFR
ncbi:MAG: TIR domain-containing protein [Pseudomonadota bacterium]